MRGSSPRTLGRGDPCAQLYTLDEEGPGSWRLRNDARAPRGRRGYRTDALAASIVGNSSTTAPFIAGTFQHLVVPIGNSQRDRMAQKIPKRPWNKTPAPGGHQCYRG